jgi:hypothetical protein
MKTVRDYTNADVHTYSPVARALAVVLFSCLLSMGQDEPAKSSRKVRSAGGAIPDSAQAVKVDTPSIQDNSFLIEEAYNQEDGIIQHISFFQHSLVNDDWVYTLTDEWPLRGLKHQLSFSVSGLHVSGFANSGVGWGDTALNYRYQLIGDGAAKVAVAPRFTLLFPSGDWRVGHGSGGVGLQASLPVSIQHGQRLATHWNAGATWIPHAHDSDGHKAGTVGVNLGQSFVWLASSRFNALLETTWNSSEQVVSNGLTSRRYDVFVSPGIRWAYNFKNGLQIVPGVGLPLGVGPSSGNRALILYLSFEHPLRWARSHPAERE